MNRTSLKPNTFYACINIFLIVLIVALYFLLSSSQSIDTMSSSVKYRGDSSNNRVALQFAVSWNAPALKAILATLQEHDLHATFFVTGDWARNNTDILCDMAQLGHEIGTLGMNSTYNTPNISLNALKSSLAESIDVIETACDVRPNLYFCSNTRMQYATSTASSLKLECVQCTIDLLCGRGSAVDIVERAKSATSGCMILMTPTQQCAQALSDIIAFCTRSNLNMTTTSMVLCNN